MSAPFKTIWFLYVLSAILTALIPTDFDTMAAVLTVGLSIPLFGLAPNFLLYSTPVVAALALQWFEVGKLLRLSIALAGIGMIAIMPGIQSMKAAQFAADTLVATDISINSPQQPRHIELVWPPFSPTVTRPVVEEAPCEEICQKLLIGSEADSVTVKILSTSLNFVHSVTYQLEKRPACPATKFSASRTLPYTKWLDRRGTCIIATVDAKTPEDAVRVVTASTSYSRSYIKGISVPREQTVRRVEIIDPTQPYNKQLRYRQTELKSQVVNRPLRIGIGGYGLRMDMKVSRSSLETNTIDIPGILRAQLGYKLEIPTVKDSTSSREEELLVLLDRPGSEPFSPIHDKLISGYAAQLKKQRNLTEAQLILIRRIIADPRINNTYFVADLLGKFTGVAERLLPEIMEKLSRPVQQSSGHSHAAFARQLTRVPPGKLDPYAGQIIQIIRSDGEWPTSALLTVVGKLKINPVSVLASGLTSRSGSVRRAALIGICESDIKWKDYLLPPLEKYMQGKQLSYSNVEGMVPGVLALQRFGSVHLAKQIIDRLDHKTSTRLNGEIATYRKRYKNSACSNSPQD